MFCENASKNNIAQIRLPPLGPPLCVCGVVVCVCVGGEGSVRCGGGYTSTYITIFARTQRLGNVGFANLVHLKGFSPAKIF